MQTLRVEHVTKSYGEKTLFKDLSLLINEHDRIGLIGINGTGKSSLMAILAEKDRPDSGELIHSQDYEIGYLSQETTFPDDWTLSQIIFAGNSPILKAVRHYEEALAFLMMDSENEMYQKAFTKAEDMMNQEDAWNADTEAKSILQKLGLSDLQQTFGELSGGQQKRVGLAQVLIQAPDLLLLDEPTNHLDYEAIEWLEHYLENYKGALVLITHDRYFLDHVTNRIVELENGQLYTYTGNYQDYLKQKAERIAEEDRKAHKAHQLFKQELAWMRAGVQGRGTKQEARKKRFASLKQTIQKQQNTEQMEMNFEMTRLGKKVLELKDASYHIENKTILNHFNLLVQRQDRIGIIGENGAGKTTLLSILAGEKSLEAGEYIIGDTVHLAYYRQNNIQLNQDKRVIQYLQETAEEVTTAEGEKISVTEMLERFLFPRHMHGTLIRKLSGGEKRRLYLLQLLMTQPNVLLLDEPTNDLDIETLTILEDYLAHFKGAVITVSHDRYFLDKVAERLLIFKGNGDIESFFGAASDYLAQEKENPAPKLVKEIAKKETDTPKAKYKLTYMEQKEWESIEEDLDRLENEKQAIQEQMNQETDYVILGDLQKTLDDLTEQLDTKWERYAYLEQYVD